MSIQTRFLLQADMPQLLQLEARKWENDQAADEMTMRSRIITYPDLCIGAFEVETGELLASLFMKPVHFSAIEDAQTWSELAAIRKTEMYDNARDLFGISLSSVCTNAVDEILMFFWPYALKKGWRHIYLGSPMPGLRTWLNRYPEKSAAEYATLYRGKRPLDPQLRYYRTRGFKTLVTVKDNYFPHHDSLDYGAILRGAIPLAKFYPVWRLLPLPWLMQLRQQLFRIL